MRHHVLARRAGIGLGVTYLLLGVAETVRLVVTGDGGLIFWFGTLVVPLFAITVIVLTVRSLRNPSGDASEREVGESSSELRRRKGASG